MTWVAMLLTALVDMGSKMVANTEKLQRQLQATSYLGYDL
jgi:hypothetical protein